MKRLHFIQLLASVPLTSFIMKYNSLKNFAQFFATTPKMPVLFLGHGSPMNAIEENQFVEGFRNIAKDLPTPNAILCISAHWETKGTKITAMQHPKTIHDFGGFPQELFDVQYPAPGHPELAQSTKDLITKATIELDHEWGLDHGAWSVIKHLYPEANIPVIQLSLDYNLSPKAHFELAEELMSLRKKGVLIIGSGNMVHNLRMVDWKKLNNPDYGFDWAIEAQTKMTNWIKDGNRDALIHYSNQGKAFELAIPTPEHYLPLLYTLALQDDQDELEFFNDKAVGGSLTMTSLKIYT